MKESYGESLASHTGSESCAGSRKATREALTGAQAGRVLSREMYLNQSADVVRIAEGHIDGGAKRASIGLCEVLDPCMFGNSTRENREALPMPESRERAGWRR
jgi:hypothetical protein